MSVQTSYDQNIGVAYAGLIYAQAPHDIISRVVETVAGVEFGVAVGRGTDKDKQTVVGTADYLGVSVRSRTLGCSTRYKFRNVPQSAASISSNTAPWAS